MGKLTKGKILTRDESKCVICGSKKQLEIGHYISRFNGGHGCEDNLQTECHKCNNKNGNKNRQGGAVKGCKGCSKPILKRAHKRDKKHREYLFECYNCNECEIKEKSLTSIIERKDNHFLICSKQVNKGVITEL